MKPHQELDYILNKIVELGTSATMDGLSVGLEKAKISWDFLPAILNKLIKDVYVYKTKIVDENNGFTY